MRTTNILIGLLLAVGLSCARADEKQYCHPSDPDHVKGDSGVLVIRRNSSVCSFIGQDKTKFFALQTNSINLRAGDFIEITSNDPAKNLSYTLTPPLAPGYIVLNLFEPKVEFHFANPDDTEMEVNFVQNSPNVPIAGDSLNEIQLRSLGTTGFNLLISKSAPGLVHLEVTGTSSSFSHLLISEAKSEIPIKPASGDTTITVNSSPVLDSCSATFLDTTEQAHEISGPDPKTVKSDYRCVNLFKTTLGGDQAHYDVDFSNFLDLSADNDKLVIDDGVSEIDIHKKTASTYPKQIVSFQGKDLAVIYIGSNPKSSSLIQFKLTVKSKSIGGILNKPGAITLPAKGTVRYELHPQSEEFAAIEIPEGKLTGLSLIVSDVSNGNRINLSPDAFVPKIITANTKGSKLVLDLEVKLKPAMINYKPTAVNLGGLISNLPGYISDTKPAQAGAANLGEYYWLVSAPKSRLRFDNHDFSNNGCLEIHLLTQKDPVFSRCKISQDEILPEFNLEPYYVKLTNSVGFLASVLPIYSTASTASNGYQTTVTSIGYPHSNVWSSIDETYHVDNANKSALVSVVDLDLRKGEKFLVNNVEIATENFTTIEDIVVKNKSVDISLKRSGKIEDFSYHKGFKVVSTQYQQIIKVNTSTSTFASAPNLTSLLVKIPATGVNRIAYNVTLKPISQDYEVKVVDSESLFGREVYEEEKFIGNSTANQVTLSFRTTKANTTLPPVTLTFKEVVCNKTVDHICDNSKRCVPAAKLCKGRSYCLDGSDLKLPCASGPAPNPKVIETGVSGVALLFVSILMLALGAIGAIYGPDLYRNLDTRFRSGQYTTFTSSE